MASRRSVISYEIRSGRKVVFSVDATTPYEALREYLRSIGCRDGEVSRHSADAVAWRGALYRAVPTESGG